MADLRQSILDGRLQEADMQRMLEEQLAAEREKRVAHLQQMGIRRLMNAGLSRGWTAWHDLYQEQMHQKRMLQAAGARLRKPKLVAAFKHWEHDWEATQRAITEARQAAARRCCARGASSSSRSISCSSSTSLAELPSRASGHAATR